MNVVKEFRNDLLSRNELEFLESYDSNPGFEKVTQDISKKMNVTSDKIYVRNILGNFGSSKFHINAFVYDSVEDLREMEVSKKKKKEVKK